MGKFTFLRTALFMAVLSIQAIGAVNIVPKMYFTARNTTSGTTNWSISNASIDNATTDYWKMLNTSSLVSPVMNFSAYTNIQISLSLASFSTIVSHSDDIKVEIWDGSNWSQVGSNLHTTGTTGTQSINITSTYASAKLRITAPNATTSAGARVFSIDITGSLPSAPTFTPDNTSNTVDNDIDITFPENSTYSAAITAVKVGTTALAATDYAISSTGIKLKPSNGNTLLTTAGSKSITVVATGYADGTVTQAINVGEPTANSTATISAAIAPGVSRTVTCTAKDQYNNLVSGYTFKYNLTTSGVDATTVESYTIDGVAKTASESGVAIATATNASGVATFTVALPATIDANESVSVQVKLNNGTTSVGSAFSFTQLQSQTITFGALTAVTYGDASFELSATASSTLPVAFASSNTAVATVSGTTVTIVGPGATNITATQSGNATYNAAIAVVQPLTVNVKPLTISGAAVSSKPYDGLPAAVITGTLSGKVGSDVVSFNGTGTFADVNANTGIAVTSTSTLTGADAAKYSLTQPTGLTGVITKADQTITFPAIPSKTNGDASFTLSPTASSGLTVSLASSNELVATVAGLTVTIVGQGTTNITATQSGNNNYNAATAVMQPLNVAIASPVANAATGVSESGFTANWGAVAGSTGYVVDVYTRGSVNVTTTSDLIISEYVEGSGNNKYIEIYNGTGSAVDLSNYKLQCYPNGGTGATYDNVLSGTLNNGEVVVYKNSGASAFTGTSIVNTACNYNGDDAIALYKISSSSFVDIVGRIGEDPGTDWNSGASLSTADKTLRRKSTVMSGVTTNPSSGFPTLATEWDVYAIDNVAGLGSHSVSGTRPVSVNEPIPNSPFTVSVGSILSLDFSGLTQGTYYYTVKSTDGVLISVVSSEIAVTLSVPTSLAPVLSDGSIYAKSGAIVVKGGAAFEVYNAVGQSIAKVQAGSDVNTLSLRPGIYVVKTAGKTTKVVVR